MISGGFCKAIAFGFSTAEKSTESSVGERACGDSLGREKSFEPIRTFVGRKVPHPDEFELYAITMQKAAWKRDRSGVGESV